MLMACLRRSFFLIALILSPRYALADYDVQVEFLDTATETQTFTESFKNCASEIQRFSFKSQSAISQTIGIENRRTTSAGASVGFGKSATVSVGAEIEDVYRASFNTTTVTEQGTQLTVPPWKTLEYTYDVIEVWQTGRVTVSEDSWFSWADDETYEIRRLKSVEYKVTDTKELQQCLHSRDWRIKDTVELTDFRNVAGDCEMDTNNNNSVKVEAKASLRDIRGDKVTLDVQFTMWEGRDNGGDGDTRLQDKGTFTLVMNDKQGYRIEKIQTNPNFFLRKREVNRGKTHGLRTIPQDWLRNFFVKEIKYELDGPGKDCKRAYASFFVEIPVRIIQDPG